MRLLSGEEIGVDQLYVDVWVLNRSPSTFQVSQSKLLETFDLRNDRLGLGDRIQRNPGFEVANKKSKLVILGKPGSGKTTFLKHLAVDWCKGQFQPDLITVLIEFRQIRGEQWHLIDAIGEAMGMDDGHQIRALKEKIEAFKLKLRASEDSQQRKELQQQLKDLPLQMLLTEGKLLVLMDGLDEVPTNALRGDIPQQLRTVAEEYPKNRFILTCRTQIITSIPSGFASVEVADFSPKQVQQFVQNWFTANDKSSVETAQKWETLRNATHRNTSMRELTVTPVLLSLMCLVLQDEGEIPSETTWLYQKAIRLLLNRWNDDKQINEWEIGSGTYRQLSVEQKEKLLIEIAARKFENPKNSVLFEQEEIAAQITRFLKLANREEGVAVLKAIEAQHGLLIERADELWSFSHLTFQEYFTVQWLTQISARELAEKVENRQWKEVVKQLVKSQQPADRLLQLVKQAIDRSLASEPIANQFLTWVFQKAQAIQTDHKLAAIRAFYFTLVRARALDLTIDRARARALDLALALDLVRTIDLSLALDLDLDLDLTLDLDLDVAVTLAPDLALDLALTRALVFDLDLALDLALTRALERTFDLALDLDFALDLYRDYNHIQKLINQLEQLRTDLSKDLKESLRWNRIQWAEQLRQAMIEHRNIGHDWQFTSVQKQQLQRYYNANKFLVELMNIEGAVSNDVRAKIEDMLLLPWDELQRRQPEIYGQRQVE